MAVKPEQVGSRSCWGKNRYKRYLKKQYSRLMRRLAKRDPEGAPTKKKFSGWEL